jgi:hypothetical protein
MTENVLVQELADASAIKNGFYWKVWKDAEIYMVIASTKKK